MHKGWLLRTALVVLLLGVACTSVWAITYIGLTFNYNAWYGYATSRLIETSIREIEDGNLERVLKVWRGLARQYQSTYEDRARYDELVSEATQRIRGDSPIEPGTAWDATTYSRETWDGHWEEASGYWLVIDAHYGPFDIVRSGGPSTAMKDVTVSSDFTVVKFKEDNRWLHTLTLKNKYELSHEWFSLEENRIWETETMYKLVRASKE